MAKNKKGDLPIGLPVVTEPVSSGLRNGTGFNRVFKNVLILASGISRFNCSHSTDQGPRLWNITFQLLSFNRPRASVMNADHWTSSAASQRRSLSALSAVHIRIALADKCKILGYRSVLMEVQISILTDTLFTEIITTRLQRQRLSQGPCGPPGQVDPTPNV